VSAYEYRGLDRNGVHVYGKTAIPPLEFIAEKYRQGWKRLEATRSDEVVGAIEVHKDTHKRIWWASE
jgi:hypothetical protein